MDDPSTSTSTNDGNLEKCLRVRPLSQTRSELQISPSKPSFPSTLVSLLKVNIVLTLTVAVAVTPTLTSRLRRHRPRLLLHPPPLLTKQPHNPRQLPRNSHINRRSQLFILRARINPQLHQPLKHPLEAPLLFPPLRLPPRRNMQQRV